VGHGIESSPREGRERSAIQQTLDLLFDEEPVEERSNRGRAFRRDTRRPGWNQNVTSTSQVPDIETRRACSGSGAASRVVAPIAIAISAVINRMREGFIIVY